MIQDRSLFTQPIEVSIDVASVYSILSSIVLVAEATESSGVADWATYVARRLTPQEWQRHRMVTQFMGMEALVNVAQSHDSFPDFLDQLANKDPGILRDRIFQVMIERPTKRLLYAHHPEHMEVTDPSELLQDSLMFSKFCLGEEYDDEELRTLCEAFFDYLNAPRALQELLVDYLSHFWDTHLQVEWTRQEPWLMQLVESAELPNTSAMGHFEIIEAITRRNMRGFYRPEILVTYQRLRFIPSPHCGPYVMRFGDETELCMIFDANLLRLLQPSTNVAGNELLVNKLKALGDETRLSIVRLIIVHGELNTQAIIDELGLSKAATSRHLRQLYANNVVIIRIDHDGLTKHYRLNPDFSREMQQIIAQLLS